MSAGADTILQADVTYGEGLDNGYLRLNESTTPVVCFIDTITPSKFPKKLAYVTKLKARAEELTGVPCIVVRYTQLAGANMNNPSIKAILIDASLAAMSQPHAELLYALIRETRIPTIGFCGGHHHIYNAYGGIDTPMRRLREGEPDPNPDYQPGFFKEWGFTPVRILKRDPLFEGLPDVIIVNEMHAWHCTYLPPQFDVLATTDECPVQVIKHKEKILYGTQFHAEEYDDEHPHGRIILQNFFRMAGLSRSESV